MKRKRWRFSTLLFQHRKILNEPSLASRKSGSYRQHQLGDQPALLTIFQTEFAAMQPGGAFDDVQAQASSARIAACGFRPDERTLHRFALRVRKPVPRSATLNTIAFASWRSCMVISPLPYS